MRKSATLAFSIAALLGVSSAYSVAPPMLYCVNDQGLNDSQFCAIPLSPLGAAIADDVIHHDCDIEALDVRDYDGKIFAASGDNTLPGWEGHLYMLKPPVPGATLIDLGQLVGDNGEPLYEVDGIAFHPTTGQLYVWSQGQGLYIISTNQLTAAITAASPGEVGDCPPLLTDPPTIKNVYKEPLPLGANELAPVEIEDIEWNWGGTILYGVENVHNHGTKPSKELGVGSDLVDSDSDKPRADHTIVLWSYYKDTHGLSKIQAACRIVAGGEYEIEGLESLPRTFFGKDKDKIITEDKDALILSYHEPADKKLNYAVITAPVPANSPSGPLPDCEIASYGEIPTDGLSDIEGLGIVWR